MKNKIIVLGFGNDILGDDGVALEAINILKSKCSDEIEFQSIYGGGMEILDFIEGKDKLLIIDSVENQFESKGKVVELSMEYYKFNCVDSPHYVGVPDAIRIAKELDIKIPDEIKILATEIAPQFEIRTGLSKEVAESIPEICSKALSIIEHWS
ncbi:MAG: hydrogenase maturation protease [Bacteroidota bacterium]|jgi:hydrogenase maturation protease